MRHNVKARTERVPGDGGRSNPNARTGPGKVLGHEAGIGTAQQALVATVETLGGPVFSRATTGRSASKCLGAGSDLHLASALQRPAEKANIHLISRLDGGSR
jgi:hypothetical protein